MLNFFIIAGFSVNEDAYLVIGPVMDEQEIVQLGINEANKRGKHFFDVDISLIENLAFALLFMNEGNRAFMVYECNTGAERFLDSASRISNDALQEAGRVVAAWKARYPIDEKIIH